MRVLFRADSGVAIGAGHVMRCLALAQGLTRAGAQCRFVVRAHEGALIDAIRAAGHELDVLPLEVASGGDAGDHAAWVGAAWAADARATRSIAAEHRADWVVVDHYGLDARWESSVRESGARIAAIDDLADRPHECSLLVDTTPGRLREDYAGLTPPCCELLLGPLQALLRPEFSAMRDRALVRRGAGPVRQLLVSMGGMDPGGWTCRVLDAVELAFGDSGPEITVAVGSAAPNHDAIVERAGRMPVATRVLRDARDMAELMLHADLAVGGAGSTAWERCCLGLPTVNLVLADNQRLIGERLAAAGAARTIVVGPRPEDAVARLARELGALVGDEAARVAMAAHASALVDGAGVSRVVARLGAALAA